MAKTSVWLIGQHIQNISKLMKNAYWEILGSHKCSSGKHKLKITLQNTGLDRIRDLIFRKIWSDRNFHVLLLL